MKCPLSEKCMNDCKTCTYVRKGDGRESGGKPAVKGVEYDCHMFEVRCRQECVSGGVRRTDKCPYDNYNSNSKKGVTPKGANLMADNNNKSGGNKGNNNGNFTPTFRKYSDMSDSEKACFRQGAKTSENKVKERLGFTKPKN